MPKKKPVRQYTAKNMCDAARRPPKQFLALAKQLGIEPVQEFVVNDRTFRTYDQAAMDKLLAWRMQQDQVTEPVPEPAPITQAAPAADALATGMREGFDYLRHYNDGRFTMLAAQLSTVEGLLAQILDAITAPGHQFTAAVNVAATGKPDDAPGVQ